MRTDLLRQLPMGNDFESRWLPTSVEVIGGKGFNIVMSVLINWKEVNSGGEGKITIYVTNDPRSSVRGDEIEIKTVDNTDDAELIILDPAFSFIKVKYEKGTITSGRLKVSLYYGRA